ncbi:carbohydrate esterase family 3 protein [Xylariaceae sp. FL0804]|nr:carbohydrate esterase family 3 protein [Xylariaceae sp. FL0804]
MDKFSAKISSLSSSLSSFSSSSFSPFSSFSSSSVVSVAMARKRLILLLCVPLLLIAFLFSGTASLDSEWSHKLDRIGGGFTGGGNKYRPDEDSEDKGVVYVHANGTSSASKGHGTTKYWKSKAFERPGYELPLAEGMPLRIMALGASTTRGDGAEVVDNNGFRKSLRNKLTAIGNPVNYVGTQRLGSMIDNDIEAYPGIPTEKIHKHAKHAVPKSKPNLFLVNAGSNDCFQHLDIDNFYKRYDALVQYLLEASPRSTVVLCTLLPTWDTRFNGREEVWKVNPQIRRMAKIYQEEGKPVVLAELQGPDGIQDGNIGSDGMHPGTAGYEMMATKMFEAIVEADSKGFLQTAVPIEGILDDGNKERMTQYNMWLDEKAMIDNKTMTAEEAIINEMKAGLNATRVVSVESSDATTTTKQAIAGKPTAGEPAAEASSGAQRRSSRAKDYRFPRLHVRP